ncbi:MAG: hypothetical protein Q7J73_03290 [Dehalococcoidales bacterium]|nr:hypothetical protein [Dehalococcoidales bacterium]
MNPHGPNEDETRTLWGKARASGMSRREFLILLTSAGASAVLSACAPKQANIPTPLTAPSAEPASSAPTPATPPVPTPPVAPTTTMPAPGPNPMPEPSITLVPARFVLGDLTITPMAVMAGENVTCSIQVSNIGGTEGSYTVVFKYKSSGGAIGSDNVDVTIKPGQTKAATLTTTKNESGTYYINVDDKFSQYTVTPVPKPVQVVPATTACAITSPPLSMEGINTHTELYGTGADPDIITLGPKVGGHPGWPTYEHKPGMSFEAYNRGSPVLAPFDMVLVGFRDSSQPVSVWPFTHADDVKLFFESASPDWPGMYMCVYHLLTSPLLTGHTQSSNTDPNAPPAQGYQIFWDGNYTLSPTGNAASYGALIGYKVKRGELIGFAGTVPAGVGTHSFADFYFDVPDTSVNPNITTVDRHLHLVQPGSFFYWKSYSPGATFPAGVLAYPFECDGYQLPAEQHDVTFKYTANK